MKKPGLELLACISALVLLSASCNDESTPPPPDPRDKLTGVFEMTKLENGQVYEMKIEKVGELCNNCDSLKYTNYGDLFHFIKKRAITDVDSQLQIGIINPLIDKNGKQWQISYDGSPYPPYNNNVVYRDSIKIRFILNNYPYYQQDGVPLVFDSVITHVGIRIADIE